MKTSVTKIKEVVKEAVKKQKPVPVVQKPQGFDPDLPENKQREYR